MATGAGADQESGGALEKIPRKPLAPGAPIRAQPMGLPGDSNSSNNDVVL